MDSLITTDSRSRSMQYCCRVLMLLAGGLLWLQCAQAEPKHSRVSSFISQQGMETEGVTRKLPEAIAHTEDAKPILNSRHEMSDLLAPGMAAIEQRYLELARNYGIEQRSVEQELAVGDAGKLIEDRLAKVDGLFRRSIWPTAESGGKNIERTVKLGLRPKLAAIEDPEEVRLKFEPRIARSDEGATRPRR